MTKNSRYPIYQNFLFLKKKRRKLRKSLQAQQWYRTAPSQCTRAFARNREDGQGWHWISIGLRKWSTSWWWCGVSRCLTYQAPKPGFLVLETARCTYYRTGTAECISWYWVTAPSVEPIRWSAGSKNKECSCAKDCWDFATPCCTSLHLKAQSVFQRTWWWWRWNHIHQNNYKFQLSKQNSTYTGLRSAEPLKP